MFKINPNSQTHFPILIYLEDHKYSRELIKKILSVGVPDKKKLIFYSFVTKNKNRRLFSEKIYFF